MEWWFSYDKNGEGVRWNGEGREEEEVLEREFPVTRSLIKIKSTHRALIPRSWVVVFCQPVPRSLLGHEYRILFSDGSVGRAAVKANIACLAPPWHTRHHHHHHRRYHHQHHFNASRRRQDCLSLSHTIIMYCRSDTCLDSKRLGV